MLTSNLLTFLQGHNPLLGLFHPLQHKITAAMSVHDRSNTSSGSSQADKEGYNAACSTSHPATERDVIVSTNSTVKKCYSEQQGKVS